MLCNLEFQAKLLQILIFEFSFIVNNDGGWYTIPAYDVVKNEHGHSLAIFHSERDCLYPFSEVVYSSDNKFVSIWWRGVYLTHQIKGLLLEWLVGDKWNKLSS